MAERDLLVRVIGDASSLQREFRKVDRSLDSSGRAAADFKDQLSDVGVGLDDIRVRAARGKGVGLLRFAGIGLGAGVAIAGITRGIGDLRGALEVTGTEAETFSGRMRNTGAALLGGDVVGAIDSLTKSIDSFTAAQAEAIAQMPELTKKLKEMGAGAELAAAQIAAIPGIVATPLVVQLRGARGRGPADELKNIDQQIKGKVAAIERLKRLREGGVNEAAVVTGLIQAENDLKALEQRRGRVTEALNKARRDAAARARAADTKPFRELVKGLGLKADKALLTAALNDDLAATQELIGAIQRQIRIEGRTFDLIDQLTQARLARSAIIEEQQSRVEEKARAAAAAADESQRQVMDALALDLEIAESTKSFADNQAALRAIEQEIRRQIASGGETTDLMRQLFQVRQQQADVARQIIEQRREQRNRKDFLDLGLTAEGDKATPGGGALLRRANSLEEQIKGTVLDTEKTRKILDAIQNKLRGNLRGVGKSVREAILQMLNDISSALDGEGSKKGPLTKTSGLNTRKIIDGLGLSAEQARELRGRLSGFNTEGRELAGVSGATDFPRGDRAGGFVVESHTTINLDGQQIAKVVTRNQQKAKRRNPQQKRGPHRVGGV